MDPDEIRSRRISLMDGIRRNAEREYRDLVLPRIPGTRLTSTSDYTLTSSPSVSSDLTLTPERYAAQRRMSVLSLPTPSSVISQTVERGDCDDGASEQHDSLNRQTSTICRGSNSMMVPGLPANDVGSTSQSVSVNPQTLIISGAPCPPGDAYRPLNHFPANPYTTADSDTIWNISDPGDSPVMDGPSTNRPTSWFSYDEELAAPRPFVPNTVILWNRRQRVWRWCQRNRTASKILAFLIFGIILGLVAVLLVPVIQAKANNRVWNEQKHWRRN
ncbi:hypothetical protein FN846DRAFT_922800 [Sphaerosporella brunnea]|uniref:Uncharacterized protein n=1 Tax=Sphaerosporella brunnea TaxID=1250544 RepID=A0A5J5EHU9_9PEZI|nr:hypothetical protein FN846DRAFT_922800 [Sphaerosporella brunnea]